MKRFRVTYNVGKVKYLVSYHNGISKHKDGSDFFDIATFKNIKKLNTFLTELKQKGFKDTLNIDLVK